MPLRQHNRAGIQGEISLGWTTGRMRRTCQPIKINYSGDVKTNQLICTLLLLVATIAQLSAQQITASQKSFEEIKALAEKGDLQAQADAGVYLAKRGKYEEAFQWFIKAAEKGLPMAELKVGEYYDSGLGVAKDDIESQKWYSNVV